MKKLLLILLFLPLLFSSCKKEEAQEVLPCLCEDSGYPIVITGLNVKEHKDKNDTRNFVDLINEEKVEISEQSALIYGGGSICDNEQTGAEVLVYFNGIAPYTFVYAVNGIDQPSIMTELNPYVINTTESGTYTLQNYNDAISVGTTSGSALVTILESPTALFTTAHDTLSILSSIQQFNDESIGNIIQWFWDFGDGNTSTSSNPIHTYTDSAGVYQISLMVTNNMGCSDTAIKVISISDAHWIYIPNAFTPNFDLINDKFCITYNGIRVNTFHFNLFDRFSNLVYATSDITELECFQYGWDGTHFETGNDLPMGVYTYEVYYQDFEGWSHQKNGKVSIIRDISNLSNNFQCYPQGISNCRFGDMMDPQLGFIYPTQEDIDNW